MEWITDVLTSAVSGGVTGLIGTIFSGFMLWREKKDARQHEKEMRRIDIEERRAEAELTLKQTQAESEALKITSELNAFTASLKSDKATYSTKAPTNTALVIVDVVRGLIRPVLTLTLVTILTIVTFDIINAYGGYEKVITDQGVQMVDDLIHSIIYMTNAAVLWWFGTRDLNKKIK
ncbi:TMhelix containing protein [Vibrio phage vB_ValS_PJ32]|nr:TMhelix containing protein [Vibrio phage vB_ValS_PJ32]